VTFPGETREYRTARERLLAAELELRTKIEEVAALRRTLPLGGVVKEDYVFDEGPRSLAESGPTRTVPLSGLFEPGKESLVLYSFMYGPKMKAPCPSCSSMLDSLDGAVPHAMQKVNVAVEAYSPIERIRDFAKARGWRHLRLLSSSRNTYHQDYHGESEKGGQNPLMNVFVKRDGKIHHFWASESLFVDFSQEGKGLDARHVDLFWPLWHLLDVTPEGRGQFYPKLEYGR
jgi:predicted dithiol-disulfide oxidoreductase (DUF899 family)